MLHFAARVSLQAVPLPKLGVVWSAALAVWLLAPGASADLPRPRPKPQPVAAPAPRPKPSPAPTASSAAAAPSSSVAPPSTSSAAAAPSSSAAPPPSAEPIHADTESAQVPQTLPDTAQAANARSAQAARSSFLVGASFLALLAGFWAMLRWRKSRLQEQLRAMEQRDADANPQDEST